MRKETIFTHRIENGMHQHSFETIEDFESDYEGELIIQCDLLSRSGCCRCCCCRRRYCASLISMIQVYG